MINLFLYKCLDCCTLVIMNYELRIMNYELASN